jgi:hypothetical protein
VGLAFWKMWQSRDLIEHCGLRIEPNANRLRDFRVFPLIIGTKQARCLEASTHASWPTASHRPGPDENHRNAPGLLSFPCPKPVPRAARGLRLLRAHTPPPARVFQISPSPPRPHKPPPRRATPKHRRPPWPTELSSHRGWPGQAMSSPPPFHRSVP